MTSKSDIDRIIAEIDAGGRVMPPAAQRKEATRLMLAQRKADQDKWLVEQQKPTATQESDRGYSTRRYSGD